MSDLVLRGVSKTYAAGRPAVRPVDFEVRSGEFVVLVGPSGCGKSTLLRLIAGLEDATTGQMFLDGREITKLAPAERDVSMVFQNYALYPHMTVRENIGFGLRVRKVPRAERDRAVDEAATLLELGDYLDRKPGQLSGGQRQRVALGRAIVRRPKLFLFDEPLSNLDAALRATTRNELRRLHERLGATTIYVTHDQVEAMSMADRLVVLRDGKVEQAGTPLEIYRRPVNRFVATFMGTPPMKVIRAEARERKFQVAGKQWPPDATTWSGPIELGYRAENLELRAEPNGSTIPVRVVLNEAMGNESLVTCALGDGQEVVVRAAAENRVAAGCTMHLQPAGSGVLFFDPASGDAVAGGLLDALAGDPTHQVTL